MTDNMRVSDKGILEIAEHEGIVPAPYRDSVGVLTYGIGHTANAGGLDPAKMPMEMPDDIDAAIDHAISVFRTDLASYERRVNEAITANLRQHEFDALVSFDFNTGGIHRARLTRLINAGDPDAAAAFMGWLRPVEIRGRRTAEMNLFKTGNYDANGDLIPVWKTDGNGNLRGQLKTLSGSDVLRRMGRGSVDRSRPTQSTTLRAQVIQWLTGSGGTLWAAWNATDDTTRMILAAGAVIALLAGAWIFKERLRKWAAGDR